jgi:hypothetical protein
MSGDLSLSRPMGFDCIFVLMTPDQSWTGKSDQPRPRNPVKSLRGNKLCGPLGPKAWLPRSTFIDRFLAV